MADDQGEDKTEDPTPRRREEARDRGQVGKSQDFNAALLTVIGIGLLYYLGHVLVNTLLRQGRFYLSGMNNPKDLGTSEFLAHTYDMAYAMMDFMFPFLAILFIAALGVNLLQVGFHISKKALEPDFERINPIKGIKNKFSLKTVMMAVMNIGKVTAASWVAYLVLEYNWLKIYHNLGNEVIASLMLYRDIFFQLAFSMLAIFLILALLDFLYQKWQHLQSLKMTKQEVRDEMKNYEGDPKIRQRRRQIQMQMSRQRMMRDVKDADVVITNPTHISVALKYDMEKMKAPLVIAKGAELIAFRIREEAKKHDIPIVENKELARSLYKLVEVGQPIPESLFQTVAEILSYVYSLKGGQRAASGG